MDYSLMPKNFYRGPLSGFERGEVRVDFPFEGLEGPPRLADLVINFWISDTFCDVVRFHWHDEGRVISRFESDEEVGDMTLVFNGVRVGNFRCVRNPKAKFQPTPIVMVFCHTAKRDEPGYNGLIEFGSVIFWNGRGIDHEYLNNHIAAFDIQEHGHHLGNAKFYTDAQILENDPSRKSYGDVLLKYHSTLTNASKHFLMEVKRLILSDRDRAIYRTDLIGSNLAIMPRALFYANPFERFHLNYDWIECVLEFNHHLFCDFDARTPQATMDQHTKEVYLLAIGMFVSRFGYQPDEVAFKNFKEEVETFSQTVWAYGCGDCEDLSYAVWVLIKNIQRHGLELSPRDYPHITNFRSLFKEYEPHACLVQASAPEFSAKALMATPVENPALCEGPTGITDISVLRVENDRSNSFHCVTFMFPKDMIHLPSGDKHARFKDCFPIEGTSSTYTRIYHNDNCINPPEKYSQNLFNILKKGAEPGALAVNSCCGDALKLPTMYLVLLDSMAFHKDGIEIMQFCSMADARTKELAGVVFEYVKRDNAAILVNRIPNGRTESEIAAPELVDAITSTQLPIPSPFIDRRLFKEKLKSIPRWKPHDVFMFYYEKTESGRNIEYLPWNLSCAKPGYNVSPWYLSLGD